MSENEPNNETTEYTPDPETAAFYEKVDAAWKEFEDYFNAPREDGVNPSGRLATEFFDIYLARRPDHIAQQAAQTAFVMWANAGEGSQRMQTAVEQIGDDLETLAGVAPIYIDIYEQDYDDEAVNALRESLLVKLGSDDRCAGLLYSMARTWMWSGQYDKARTAGERILAMNVSEQHVRNTKGMLHEMDNLNVGQMAPAFSTTDIDGNPISLAGLRGKVVLLDFWATWCGPCIGELPHLRRVNEQFAGDRFTLLSISLDDDCDAARAMIAKEKMAWRHVCEGQWTGSKIAELYNVMGIPSTWLIAPDGKIAQKGLRGHDVDKAVGKLLSVEGSS